MSDFGPLAYYLKLAFFTKINCEPVAFSYCACSNSSFWVSVLSGQNILVQELRSKKGNGHIFARVRYNIIILMKTSAQLPSFMGN